MNTFVRNVVLKGLLELTWGYVKQKSWEPLH